MVELEFSQNCPIGKLRFPYRGSVATAATVTTVATVATVATVVTVAQRHHFHVDVTLFFLPNTISTFIESCKTGSFPCWIKFKPLFIDQTLKQWNNGTMEQWNSGTVETVAISDGLAGDSTDFVHLQQNTIRER
jgi:hypothetical protein